MFNALVTPIGIWRVLSICALLELLHLASLLHFDLMPLVLMSFCFTHQAFGVQQFHHFVAIEDLGVDLLA